MDKSSGLDSNEAIVGISGYSTTTPPIYGQIKLDIADFIVREILPSGEILSTREKSENDYPFDKKKDRYTTFTLIKKNTDTIFAAKVIAEYLNIYDTEVLWAGIKDNTAITAQRMMVPGNQIERLKQFKSKNITITNIQSSRKPIEIGSLWGNNFEINIRNSTIPYENLEPVLSDWSNQIQTNGFPNFYGLQRFGQYRPNSHNVGKLLFLGKYQEAYEEFLFKVYPEEYKPIKEFRTLLASNPSPSEIVDWPPALSYEKQIYEGFQKSNGNYAQAFQKLPKALLNLIFSSYQSYLFNRVVSYRLRMKDPLGTPVKGDIVGILMEKRGLPSLICYQYGGWNDEAIEKAFTHERATILAPILGYKSQISHYPYFEKVYQEILAEENFSQDDFRNGFTGYFNYEGTYRPIFQKPTNLVTSQAFILNNYPNKDPNGIKVEFSLPKGTYATMLLRELMKN
jgi:tRNA pseudouridine13 synthase